MGSSIQNTHTQKHVGLKFEEGSSVKEQPWKGSGDNSNSNSRFNLPPACVYRLQCKAKTCDGTTDSRPTFVTFLLVWDARERTSPSHLKCPNQLANLLCPSQI